MKLVAACNVWNSALWITPALNWWYDFADLIVIDETNWTSTDSRWKGKTSPDGTAALIRQFPDPQNKIRFRQLGSWSTGCLAARAALCDRLPECDWVYVADCDEFQMEHTVAWLKAELPGLHERGYTTVSQHTRSYYWDFRRHTLEGFTRLFRWHAGINLWNAQYRVPKDFNIPAEFGETVPSADQAGHEIFHYSYVPVPGVEIKGAQSFDVSLARYQGWYQNVFAPFDGKNLEAVYARNQGGVHVFGGLPVALYSGSHPSVLDTHPLRYALWCGNRYEDREGNPIALKGWWNR